MSVLAWLNDPPTDRGMHLLDRDGGRRFHSYADLALLARRAARRLRGAGVAAGDVVLVVRPASPEFMADYFGALLLGATPSPIAPPDAIRDRAAYLDHLVRAVRLLPARAVATTAAAAPVLAPALDGTRCALVTDIPEDLVPVDDAPVPPEIGLIQFSSGSTGAPRGVRIPFAAFQSNVSALYRSLRLSDRDTACSWLPLHHDMGLIGLFMLPIEGRFDLWMMPPADFIRSPLSWLRCFGPGGATMTGSPTFGLAHIVRRVRPDQLAGLDLSGWRGITVGAERVDPKVIEDFLALLKPCGLRPEVITPAYGLAESTLAVTAAPCDAPVRTVTVDGGSLAPGRPVVPLAGPGTGTTLVSCGRPVAGVGVRIVDEDGAPVGPDVLGEIEVSGDSLAAGYLSEHGVEPFGGRLPTGDAGFLHDGDLYVVGRLGDAVKQLGQWFFAEDAERIAAAESPRPRQTVALVGSLTGRNTVAVLIEGSLDRAADRVGRAVVRHVTGLRVLVITVRAGEIARTTSGKPRRRVMWRRLADGGLDGTVCWDSDAARAVTAQDRPR